MKTTQGRLIIYFVCWLLSTISFGQQVDVDSLLQEFKQVDDVQSKLKILNILSENILTSNADSALIFAQRAEALAMQEGDVDKMTKALENQGRALASLKDYDSAISIYQSALIIIENDKYNNLYGYLYGGMGLSYYNLGETTKARDSFLRALRSCEITGDSLCIVKTGINLGVSYSDLGNYNEALAVYNKIIKIAIPLAQQKYLAQIYNKTGTIYFKREEYDKAIRQYEQAHDIATKMNDPEIILKSLNNKALVYATENDYKSALDIYNKILLQAETTNHADNMALALHNLGEIQIKLGLYNVATKSFERSLALMQETGNIAGQSRAYHGIGLVYMTEDRYGLALKPLTRSFQLAVESNDTELINESSYALFKYYEELDDSKNALQYYRTYYETQDSLYNEENTKKLIRMEAEYEFKKELDSLSFLQEKIAFENQQKISRQAFIQKIMIGGFVVVLIFLAIILRYSRQKRRANMKLAERNMRIQAQKAKITTQRDQLEQRNKVVSSQKIQLEKVNEELQQLNEEKNMLMGVVAHDLKAPLNHIAGLAHIARLSTNDPDEVSNCLIKIEESAQNSTAMIRRILDIGAIERKDKIETEQTNISPLLESVVDDFQLSADNKHIKLHLQGTEIPHTAIINKDYYLQVIQNVVSNAIKFSSNDKSIYISLQEESDFIVTSIKDEGPGISEEDQSKMFKKYETLSAKPTGGESSTGLGLAIVKKFVEAMNGKVECRSKLGEGTTFIIKFPSA